MMRAAAESWMHWSDTAANTRFSGSPSTRNEDRPRATPSTPTSKHTLQRQSKHTERRQTPGYPLHSHQHTCALLAGSPVAPSSQPTNPHSLLWGVSRIFACLFHSSADCRSEKRVNRRRFHPLKPLPLQLAVCTSSLFPH
ncbi:hypothetical protein LSTR_LSTR017580 [Laodelphax striatellus]|uniref:Uncharacterized protein n=1 Tax=Laodelphax striatellus TaxID=195883 RepID=A0A482X0B6_LAOST|nr:hypothetical protein LSTR_LSTR017580 [Laodelphax striatellus]